jgi:hypothetical protein
VSDERADLMLNTLRAIRAKQNAVDLYHAQERLANSETDCSCCRPLMRAAAKPRRGG